MFPGSLKKCFAAFLQGRNLMDSSRRRLNQNDTIDKELMQSAQEGMSLPDTEATKSSLVEDPSTPIAIIGMSFKFPQGLETAEKFWDALKSGRSAWSKFPRSRLNFEGIYDPDAGRLNGFPLKGAHFVEGDIGAFDAPFFTISPGEAAEIDPQSRTLLETTYRALENAGLPFDIIANTKISVYTGSFGDDYKAFSTKDPQFGGQYSASSVSANMLANRISWFFNLRGESINMDTACSSTLVAFHNACKSLRLKEIQMAIVAGSNLFLSPDMAMSLNNQGFLSPDGRCWSFSEKANGYGRGEGFCAIILRRIEDAIEHNDNIRAVVRASGTNQDGRTPGIVQPSRVAQGELITETYRKAGLDMQLTRYVEAHGTGTPVGDPIEAGAIADAFKDCISSDSPLYVGSVKSNIGHLEGTSGLAGVVKSVLMLEHGIIPPIAGLGSVNGSITDYHPHLMFPKVFLFWPSSGLRRLSINSFGFGGTNAHVVIDDAENFLRQYSYIRNDVIPGSQDSVPRPKALLEKDVPSVRLLVFSAQDEDGLKRQEQAYRNYLSQLSNLDRDEHYLTQLAYTLGERRSLLLWRSFIVCKGTDSLQGDGFKMSKPLRSLYAPRLLFCFTGQGAQWFSMGRQLSMIPTYAESILRSSKILSDMGCPWNICDELARHEHDSKVDDPEFSQSLCTALQLALIDLLEDIGLLPVIVVGHSSGEIAAAYCTGALDRRSALAVAYYRGLLSSKLARKAVPRGGMLAVSIQENNIVKYFETIQDQFRSLDLSIGCFNSPGNVTITGALDQITYLSGLLKKQKIFTRMLAVGVAYHSKYMNAIADDYLKAMGRLERRDSRPMILISTVTGGVINSNELTKKDYWVKNMVSPVKFMQALTVAANLRERGPGQIIYDDTRLQFEDVLEIGPHGALRSPISEILKSLPRGSTAGYASLLIRRNDAVESFFNAIGYLHCRGHGMSIKAVNDLSKSSSPRPKVLKDLPEYPFDHSRSYWRESRLSQGHRFRNAPRSDFVGIRVPDWNPKEAKWRRRIKLSEDPWIADHKIAQRNILPAAAMLVMAIEAAKSVTSTSSTKEVSGYMLKDVVCTSAIQLGSDADGTEVEFYLRSDRSDYDRQTSWSEFFLYAIGNETWNEACRGSIRVCYSNGHGAIDKGFEGQRESQILTDELFRIRTSCSRNVDPNRVYALLRDRDIDFGPAHQVLKACAFNENRESFGEIATDQWKVNSRACQQQNFTIHPTTLDGLFQLGLMTMIRDSSEIEPGVVARIHRLWVAALDSQCSETPRMPAWSRFNSINARSINSDATAFDAEGQKPIVIMQGLEVKFLNHPEAPSIQQNRRLCWNFKYLPDIELLSEDEVQNEIVSGLRTQPPPIEFDRDVKVMLYASVLRNLRRLKTEERSSLLTHHQRYLQWMQREEAKISSNGNAYDELHLRRYLTNDVDYEQLVNRLEDTNARGKFFAVLARNLHDILTGQKNALEIMFQTPLVKEYYRELYKSTNGLSKVLGYLDLYAHKNPDINILEIGAGTGGMTRYILERLTQNGLGMPGLGAPRFMHYTYTDISAGFFANARSLFEKFPEKVTFSVLDIERDPALQGFETGSYDLVIADNVLHATEDLDVTIRHVKSLLKPGGKLALFELTNPEVIKTNFAFGLLPGWWRFRDSYRSFSAGVSVSTWDTVLKSSGFDGIDLSFHDFDDPCIQEHSVLISTACKESRTESTPSRSALAVYSGDLSRYATIIHYLTSELESAGVTITVMSLEQAASLDDLGGTFCISLLELEDAVLRSMSERQYEHIKKILRNDGGLLWVCRSGGTRPSLPDHALIQGALRALRMEERSSKLITLSLDSTSSDPAYVAHRIRQVFDAIFSKSVNDCETEYVERSGLICIDRFVEADYLNRDLLKFDQDDQVSESQFGACEALTLSISFAGLLDTLTFINDRKYWNELLPDEIEIKVKASGVNFRDCLIALGRIPGNSFGFECSGTISRLGCGVSSLSIGERVCVGANGTYATYTRCKASDVIRIPDSMSFAEAAALPVVFTTAWYALVHVARIQKGESILVHSAAGGTGQAAIQIAKLFEVEVFATVGNEEKRTLIETLYDIPRVNIFDSRDFSFSKGIRRITSGKGVDVVLNSLSGDLLVESWQCLAPLGRFIEIGKKDILTNNHLPMLPFSRSTSFHAVDLNEIRHSRPMLLQTLQNEISDLLVEGKISPPQPMHTYQPGDIEIAFRYLQSGKNTGKTVVEFKEQDIVKVRSNISSKWEFDATATYVIAGGLGGIGRRTARWMANRGARYLILLSRTGPTNDEARELVEDLIQQGVHVETPLCNIADFSSLRRTLIMLQKTMPPIKGCIQSAMSLKSRVFENMTFADWRHATEPKVSGTWNLHCLLPQGMDFFLMFSSIAGGIGGTASVNYSSACSYQDALAHYRNSIGEKATTLNLGVMVDDGVLRDNEAVRNALIGTGYLLGITQKEMFALLEKHCDPSVNIPETPLASQVLVGVDIPANIRSRGMEMPIFMSRPLFRGVWNIPASQSNVDEESPVDVVRDLSQIRSLHEAADIIAQALMHRLSGALGVPLENLDSAQPMHAYGVDSLVAVELRNWFKYTLEAEVAVFEILNQTSFENMGNLVAGKSKVVAGLLGKL